MSFARRRFALCRVLLGLLPAGLVACTTVGPDYHGAPALPAGTSQFVRNHPIVARPGQAAIPLATTTLQTTPWWMALGDPVLTQLIQQALTDSPDLQAAQARLAQAQAGLAQQTANGRPKATTSALAGGLEQGPGSNAERGYHGYTASMVASWELDLFGGERRSVEAASATRDAVAADLTDAQLALAASVANEYVQVRHLQAQLLRMQARQQDAQAALMLTRQRQTQGVATSQEVEQRTTQLALLDEQASQLQSDRDVALDQLALLCGQVPAALDSVLTRGSVRLPHLPATLQIGDPAMQLQHRPDVRAAERRLAASTAQIGVQKANYFPKVTLLGGVSVLATEPSALLKQSSLGLLGGPMLSWDVLDFNRTTAAVNKAGSVRDEALANYRASVLRALNDANSALTRYRQQSEIRHQKTVQLESANHDVALVMQRRAAGVATEIEVLDAKQTAEQAEMQDQDAQTALINDYILLQKSLGVGWMSANSR